MFTENEFEEALTAVREQLLEVIDTIGKIRCPRIETLSVDLRDLTEERIEELLDSVPSGYRKEDKDTDYVYVLRIESSSDGFQQRLVNQLQEARNQANDYCRVNDDHIDTNTLYVGRSKKLRTRLGQHLGAESRGIYSMHLQRWAAGNDAKVGIFYMRFERMDDLFVQAIEDGLWASLRPLFGRKGER